MLLKRKLLFVAAASVLVSSPAWAADKVFTGPAPAWVTAAPALANGGTADVLPRFDEQVEVSGETIIGYFDTATLVSSAEVMAQMGTVSVDWQPAHGDLTFHRIEILRGGQTIDVLNGGEGFSVLRREAKLEHLSVDGTLTAVKHLEGLQVGDVLHTVFSISMRDKVLAGNVQDALVLLPAPLKLSFGRARLVWPTAQPIAWRPMIPGLTLTPHAIDAKWSELVVPLPVAKLAEMPKNMPSRFQPMAFLQFSSFPDWTSVAKIMAPLYAAKGAIPPGSELANRVDAIAARSSDPEQRMAAALRLVQDEVRYQLIALGNGNYVPQAPLDTWVKRYGDCKAKTLLLLAILDRLGIEAEPVLANSKRGDAVAQMLPAAMAFDHVFVHARAKGQDYWLDGTMLGSRLADIHDIPHYGYVLPLFAADVKLVQLPSHAHARPDLDIDLAYDMTAGPHLPAPYHLILRYAGPYGEANRVQQGADYDDKLTTFAEKAAKNWTGSDTIGKPHAEWDADQAVWTLTVDGIAYPDWQYSDSRYALAVGPGLQVTFDAPRDRSTWRSIPAVIEQPWTAHCHIVTHLPDGGKGIAVTDAGHAALDLPAVTWQRDSTLTLGDFVDDIISRETGAEIPADQTSAANKAIVNAMSKTAHIALAGTYPQRWDDVARMHATPAVAQVRATYDQRIAEKPDDATRLMDRAWFEERLFDWAGAQADYTKAIALDASAAHYLSRAQLLAKRGDHAAALADAKAAYDLEQDNNDVRDQFAQELSEAGKVDEALELLPSDPDVATDTGLSDLLERAYVMELGNRHDDALSLLDAALAKRDSSAALHNARCWYRGLRASELDAALTDCNKAIELASDPADYLDSRAMVEYRAGKIAQSLADYEAALAASPEQVSSLFMAGVVRKLMGETTKGEADLAAARIVDPDIDRFYQRFGIKP